MADERNRLNDRLAQLDEERGHIAYALAVLDRLDPDKSPVTQRAPGRGRREASGGRPGGTYDRAVRVINASDRTWRINELIVAMRQDGWAAQVTNEIETVRSALSRAVHDGLIDRPEQGVFMPKGWQASGADVATAGDEAAIANASGDEEPAAASKLVPVGQPTSI